MILASQTRGPPPPRLMCRCRKRSRRPSRLVDPASEGGMAMTTVRFPETHQCGSEDVSRRRVIRKVILGGAGAALVAQHPRVVRAEDATPEAQDCVAIAP